MTLHRWGGLGLAFGASLLFGATIGFGSILQVPGDRILTIAAGVLTAALLCLTLHWLIVAGTGVSDHWEGLRGLQVAFAIRVVAAFVFHAILVEVNWRGYGAMFFDDEPYFDYTSWAISGQLLDGILDGGSRVLYPFQYFVAAIYAMFGHEILLVRVFNGALGALLAPLAFYIARCLFPDSMRIARTTMWIVALAPDSILWSVAMMRDIQLALGMTVIVFLVVTLERKPAAMVPNAIRAVVVLVFNLAMRPVLGWLQLLALGFYALLSVGPGGGRGRSRRLVIVAMVGGVALGADLLGTMFGYHVVDLVSATKYIQEEYVENQQYLDRYYGLESQYSLYQLRGGVLEPVSLVVTLVRGTLQPSPLWVITVGNFSTVLWLLPGMVWYVTIPFFVLGIVLVPRVSGRAGIFVVAIAVATYVAGTAGLGAGLEPVRARVPVLPLLQMMAAYAFVRWREGAVGRLGRLWFAAYTGAVVLGGMHYLVWSATGGLPGVVLAVGLGVLCALVVHSMLTGRRQRAEAR